MSSRDDILNKIKLLASSHQAFDMPEPDWNEQVLSPVGESLLDRFKTQLEQVNGVFHLLNNVEVESTQIKKILSENQIIDYKCLHQTYVSSLNPKGDESKAVIISCDALIAYSGSVLITSKTHERWSFVFPENVVVIASESQIVPCLKDGIELIKRMHQSELPSLISLITGPSRTADIEKTLVMGAHGAKKLIVILRSGNNI